MVIRLFKVMRQPCPPGLACILGIKIHDLDVFVCWWNKHSVSVGSLAAVTNSSLWAYKQILLWHLGP